MNDYGFGWIPPDDEHLEKNARYPFALLGLAVPATVSAKLITPDLWDFYNQKATPRCVAFSSQFMSSVYAYNYHISMGFTPTEAIALVIKYDTSWLWKAIGGTNQGAMIEDSLDVLRKGDVVTGTTVQVPKEGIQNYVHIRSAEDIRTAAASGMIGLLGIPWHHKWMTASNVLDDNPKTWGVIDGYHSILWNGWDDSIDGTWLANSWGKSWSNGNPVGLTRKAIDYMLARERGEGYVITDIPVEPLPPPTEKSYIDLEGVMSSTGKRYSGRLKEV
jgi:hypothetical protein